MSSTFVPSLRWLSVALITAMALVAQAQTKGPTEGQQLEARRAAEEKQCHAHARKAGLPPELVTAMYLTGVNSPIFFAGIPCAAVINGVTFRYQSGGLLGSEGFEIKGRSTVSIKVKRAKMDEGRVLLIPVHSTVNGNSQDVTRLSIQVLTFEMQKALRNE